MRSVAHAEIGGQVNEVLHQAPAQRGRRSLLRCPFVNESAIADLAMMKVNYPCGWFIEHPSGAEKAHRPQGRLYGAAG